MHEHSLVSAQIGSLARAEQHGQPEILLPEQRLDRADPRGPVSADRANEHHAWLLEPLTSKVGQTGSLIGELTPVHE